MKSATPSTKTESLQANVKLAQQNRRWKDAIGLFKDLLKLERRPDWEQGLADAYRQRALQVAEKGMWQESIILWDNYAKLDPRSVPSDAYLGWLIQAGQFPKLAKLLVDASPALNQGPVGRRLPETLAVLALQNDKLLVSFPQEHPIAKQHPLIKNAIRAFCAGHDDLCEEALRQIPSRSPYRNVRTLLKAMLQMGKDRAGGLELLDRIEADSACRSFAQVLQTQAQTSGPDLSVISELPPKQQAFIYKFNGYSKSQLNLLRDFKKIAKSSSHRLVLSTVLSNRVLLGDFACRRFCLSLLVDFPEGMDLYQRAFGKLSEFERQRIYALHEATQGNYPHAAAYWRNAIDQLALQTDKQRAKLDNAAILRYIAKLAETEVPNVAIDSLAKSLQVDPDDQPTYLALIRLNEKIDSPKQAQEWLEKGLEQIPKDVELLTMAMNAANRRKAFKKAANLAKTLLKIDPINSPARQLLIGAHIGHARKLSRAGKFALAQQELNQARSLEPHRRNASLCLLEGLLALLQHDTKHAQGLLAEGWQLSGGGLCAQFQLNFETLCLDQPLGKVAGLIPGLDKKYLANRAELSGLVKLVSQYYDGDKRCLSDALKPLKAILKKSFIQPGLGEDDYFNLGQALAHSAQFDLLEECATAASRHLTAWPAATYFRIYAKCKGVAERMTPMDENSLQNALERARHKNDRRTRVLIENFFRELDQSTDFDFDEDLPPGLEDLDPAMMPTMMNRFMEVEYLPREELLGIIFKGMPGLPVNSLSDAQLVDIARLIVMKEFGLDLEGMGVGHDFLGPKKKLPKSR